MINNLHHCRLKICTYDCFQRIWEVSNFKISIRVDPRWSGFQVPSVWVPVLDKGWMMGVRVIDHVSQMTCCHRIILELPPPYPPEKDDEQHNNKQAPKKQPYVAVSKQYIVLWVHPSLSILLGWFALKLPKSLHFSIATRSICCNILRPWPCRCLLELRTTPMEKNHAPVVTSSICILLYIVKSLLFIELHLECLLHRPFAK